MRKISKKMGRPTNDPKPYKITVRVGDNEKEILENYTTQEDVTQMEAVRRGIKKLESDIKKK